MSPRRRAGAGAAESPHRADAPVGAAALSLPGLGRLVAPGRTVRAIAHRASPYASTHALEEVDLELDEGERLSVVLKAFGDEASASARGTRPAVVVDGHREAWAYREVLDAEALDTPRFLGTLSLAGGGRRLVIEKVRGLELYQLGDLDAWRAAARWLARFHAWGRGRARGSGQATAGRGGRGLRHDADLHRALWQRAVPRLRARGGEAELGPADARWLVDLEDTFERAVAVLAGLPRTLVHGEFCPSNVLLETARRGWRVRPVDWESLGPGPGLVDLAALTAGEWSDEVRADLCRAYLEAAPSALVRALPRSAFEAAGLVHAIQWLGWGDEWCPPPQHARDWAAEAGRAAARFRKLEAAP